MSQTLWQQLVGQGFVSGDEPIVNSDDNAPWYIRTMLGIAGWFGALFLLGAVFSTIELFLDSALVSGMMGVAACLIAVVIYRMPKRNDFLQQFAFAVSLAGQGMVVFSLLRELNLFDEQDSLVRVLTVLSIVTICLQGLLFFAIPNYLHRIWSALLVVASVMFLMNSNGLYPFTMGILLAIGAFLWLQEFNWVTAGSKLSTLAYALVFISLLLLFAQTYLWPASAFWRNAFGLPETISVFSDRLFSLSAGVVLLGVVMTLLKRADLPWFKGAGIASILLAVLGAYIGTYVPGITVGTVLVLIGFAHGNKVLAGLGMVVLVIFVFKFYYLLELTLLAKSGLLVASGLSLLAVRQVMSYIWPRGV